MAPDRVELAHGLGAASFPGQLILLSRGNSDRIDTDTGSRLIADGAAFAAQDGRLRGAGIDAAALERGLRALLVERRGSSLGSDDLEALALAGLARYLSSRGVGVSPDEARDALRLITTGEFFADIGASTAAIVHVVPALPLAIGRDVPRLPFVVVGRLVPAILADLPDLSLAAARLLASRLLDGDGTSTPVVMSRTLRVLYDLASVRSIATTVRTLLARDNASLRLALILYARANGIAIDESDLDVLHDSVLDTDEPDLGPALGATVRRFVDEDRLRELGRVVSLLSRRPEGATRDPALLSGPPESRFEGVVFRLDPRAAVSPMEVVRRSLGDLWRCAPFSPATPDDYEATPARGMTPGEGWQASYDLAADAAVVRAEPRFEARTVENEPPSAERRARSGLFGSSPDPATDDHKWSPKLVRAFEAWQLAPPNGGARFGEGIVVGHPDTGYTNHAELVGRIVPGYDFLDEDDDPTDPLDGSPWFLQFPGHGTGTASVLVSGDEPDASQGVTGVAPGACVMPLRVSRSVIHLSMANVAKAIYHAVDHRCHVISMSLGGLGFDYLHDAVRYATDRGVIVVAAAGNYVGFVVHPAAYDEVVAAGGCTVQRRPWHGSSHGSEVDISAPAQDVWKAEAEGDGHAVVRSDGTSFATATIAGVAALWLAFHGRDRLIAAYGASNLAAVFAGIVKHAGFAAGVDWDPDEYGPGIIDARRVLEATLPPAVPAPKALVARAPHDRAFAEICRQLRPFPPAAVQAALAQALGVAPHEVAARLAEAGPELAMLLATDAELRASVTALAGAFQTRGLDIGARGGALPQARSRLRRVASRRLRPEQEI